MKFKFVPGTKVTDQSEFKLCLFMFSFTQEILDTLSVFTAELREQRELIQGIVETKNMASTTGLSNQSIFNNK